MSRKEKKEDKVSDKYTDEDNSYDDAEVGASSDDKHRDVVYRPASTVSQFACCYMTQMKRFTKQKTVWFLLILLLLIPGVYYLINSYVSPHAMETDSITNIAVATTLAMLPVISMLISSVVCGSMLPQEFNERTAYLSLPLPMSRSTFYYGKFFAGFSLVAGTIIAAYGISILLSMGHCEYSYTRTLMLSMIMSVVSVFFYCSLAYRMSAGSKRGSSMKPFLLLFIGLPLLAVILSAVFGKIGLSSYTYITGYFPCFGTDMAIGYLGVPHLAGMNMMVLSLPGFVNFVFGGSVIGIGSDFTIMFLVLLILGILCLVNGYSKIKRRNM